MNKSAQILSDVTHFMKYAKYIPELNRRETYEETVTRNKIMHLQKFPELGEYTPVDVSPLKYIAGCDGVPGSNETLDRAEIIPTLNGAASTQTFAAPPYPRASSLI